MDPVATTSPAGMPRGAIDYALAVAPTVLMVLATVIVGVLVSRLARRMTVWLVQRLGLDALAEKVGVSKMLYAVGVKQSVPVVMGQIAYWIGILLTVATLAEMLGLPGIAAGIATITAYIPRIFATALILVAGMVAADVLRALIGRAISRNKGVDSPDVIGQAVYYGVVVITATIAAEHLGFDTELINAIIQIALAAGMFGLALAFALGAGGTFRHIVARYYVTRMYRRGDRIEVDGRAGVIVGFGPAQLILDTEDGEFVVPCQHIMDAVVRIERVERSSAERDLEPEAPTSGGAAAPDEDAV